MKRCEEGFSLIEILAVILILSMGLLALAKIQIASLRNITASYFQTVALLQAENCAERIVSLSSPLQVSGLIAEWDLENRERLPEGRGEVFQNGNQYTIQVSWNEPNILGQNRGGSKSRLLKLVI
ncbi:MAG: prepilin-type N-terminal cleavage/methylation domain-containing protein [Proteobacteria bacterium]|nr:prepilin-type N-terminal cleavage/methylation domain-containing protein [Pseudomonadota bacterium]